MPVVACSNCKHKYQRAEDEDGQYVPKVLGCGHTFCLKCMSENATANKGKIVCFNCQTEQALPDEGRPTSLATNIALMDMLTEVQSDGTWSAQCPEHKQQQCTSFCRTTNAAVCLTCLGLPAHQGHEHVPIVDVVQEIRGDLNKRSNVARTRLDEIKKLQEQVDASIQQLVSEQGPLLESARKQLLDPIRAAVKTMGERHIQNLDQICTGRFEKLRAQHTKLSTEANSLSTAIAQCTTANENGDQLARIQACLVALSGLSNVPLSKGADLEPCCRASDIRLVGMDALDKTCTSISGLSSFEAARSGAGAGAGAAAKKS